MHISKQLKKFIMFRLALSENVYNQYILEYKKFLLMMKITKEMPIPSATVEQVWRCHMMFNGEYNVSIKAIFPDGIPYSPVDKIDKMKENYNKIYNRSQIESESGDEILEVENI